MTTAHFGQCCRCGKQTNNQVAITRHMQSCLEQWQDQENILESEPQRPGEADDIYWHLSVKSDQRHCMEILVPQGATLEQMDRFLRETWLECCGHLRAFQFGPLQVSSTLDSEMANSINDIDMTPLINMESEITQVLMPGFSVNHQYDFGTTSVTTLTCRSIYPLRAKPAITVVARNNPSDDEEFNSPRDGLPCFDPDSLKEPPTAPANRRVRYYQYGGRISH